MKRTPRERTARRTWIAPACVALVSLIPFLPALQNGFVSWDDEKNFLANPNYRGLGLEQLSWMWTTFHMGHYVPLSWMTLGLDYLLWGMRPGGYHLTSLLLHAANAVLVYFLAQRVLAHGGVCASTDDASLPAAFAAVLFAVHPLRVESVVWATERRDVLSLLFFLASVLAYLRAADVGGARKWYWLSVAAFPCALLSKATAMTLPAALLILELYPLKRLPAEEGWWSVAARRVYRGLVPFILLSAASVILSLVALHPPAQLRMDQKLAVSAYSLSFYHWKSLVPLRLSPLYEMPQQVRPLDLVFVGSYLLVLGITALAWRNRHRWPGINAAWLAFVAISLPMLGVVQNGPQIAADRYTYHAGAVLAILAGGGMCVMRSRTRASATRAAAVVLLAALAALTWRQTMVWRSSETLWARVLALDPGSSYARSALATLLYKQDRVGEAIEQSRQAIALAPGLAEAHNNLGVGLARQGDLAGAVEQYRLAIAINPSYDEAQGNWGVVLARQGDMGAAIDHYRQALSTNPLNADAHVNWGNALVRLGSPDEAITQYQSALTIRPDHADAQLNWGVALARLGRMQEALRHFELALAIDPDLAEASAYRERARQMLR